MVLAGGPVLLERDARPAAAVCDRYEPGADERLQGAVRLERAADVHDREVGHAGELPKGAHVLQPAGSAPVRELSGAKGPTD